MTFRELIDRQTETVPASHDRLAARLGIHYTALAHWYCGRRKLSAKNADKIAKKLGVQAVIRNGVIEFAPKSENKS